MTPVVTSTGTATRPMAVRLLVSSYLAAAGALLCGPVTLQMSAIRDSLDATSALAPVTPPLLAYGLVPVAVLSSLWLVLTPGLLLATAFLRSNTLGHWLLHGLALSLVVVSVGTESVEAMIGEPLLGARFVAVVVALATGAGVAALARPRHIWTERAPGTSWTAELSLAVALVAVLLVAMLPKFFFEAFNGDGAHTFEVTRLLMHRAVPFFDESAGGISRFPGMNSVLFVYPGAWFMRLFGETEAAVRLPFLLYLAVLGPVVLTTASAGARRPTLTDAALVAASLGVFAVVMSYSATYDPYCADIALPATQDTLFLVLLLGVVTATLEHRLAGVAALTALSVLCSQAAVAMTAFWLGARWLVGRQDRARVARQALAAVAAIVTVSLVPLLLAAAGTPAPGGEHGLLDLLRKFVTLQATDVRRVVFVFTAVGLYPALALLRLGRRDPVVDALAVFVAASFMLYFVMAYYSLHYFVPAMVLGLVLFWRTVLAAGAARPGWLSPVAAVMAAGALVVSLPVESGVYIATRDVGRRIDVSAVPGYDTMRSEAFQNADVLADLFAKDFTPGVPDRAYGGSPLAWHIYAERARGDGTVKDYVLAPASDGAWHARARDVETYARDRVAVPSGSRGARLYAVPRDLLFQRSAEHAGFPVLDFRPLVKRLFPTLK